MNNFGKKEYFLNFLKNTDFFEILIFLKSQTFFGKFPKKFGKREHFLKHKDFLIYRQILRNMNLFKKIPNIFWKHEHMLKFPIVFLNMNIS